MHLCACVFVHNAVNVLCFLFHVAESARECCCESLLCCVPCSAVCLCCEYLLEGCCECFFEIEERLNVHRPCQKMTFRVLIMGNSVLRFSVNVGVGSAKMSFVGEDTD